jgi:signal peptidase I
MASVAISFRESPSGLLRARKIISAIVWTFLTAFLLTVLAGVVYVRTGHGSLAPVLSGSMRPGIHEGDVVLTHKVPVTSLHKGDIIVFHPPTQGGTLTKVHRIDFIKQLGNGKIEFRTKGDANNAADPWGTITTSGTAYRVIAVIPKVGWLINGGLHWIVIGLLLGLAAIIARMSIKYLRSPDRGNEGNTE